MDVRRFSPRSPRVDWKRVRRTRSALPVETRQEMMQTLHDFGSIQACVAACRSVTQGPICQ